MRNPDQLVHTRTCTGTRYALMPLEGFPVSRLPGWDGAEVRVLASPTLGAGFVQMMIDLPTASGGMFTADESIETFHYVLGGRGTFQDDKKEEAPLAVGCYGLTPPGTTVRIAADQPMKLLIVRKRYEPTRDHPEATAYYGNTSDVREEDWGDNPASRLQTLLPDDPAFDLAMNVFTFDPGTGLPIIETHVMEHGLYFLDGRGLYYLDGTWMEVQRDDFIWMGPYCPQSFYATGPTPSRYLYYKNVNRAIPL